MDTILNDLINFYTSVKSTFSQYDNTQYTDDENQYIDSITNILPILENIRSNLIEKEYGTATNLLISLNAFNIHKNNTNKIKDLITYCQTTNSSYYIEPISNETSQINTPITPLISTTKLEEELSLLRTEVIKLQNTINTDIPNDILEVKKSIFNMSSDIEKSTQQVKEHSAQITETFKNMVNISKTTATSSISTMYESINNENNNAISNMRNNVNKLSQETDNILEKVKPQINESLKDYFNKNFKTNMLLFCSISFCIICGLMYLTSKYTAQIVGHNVIDYIAYQQQNTNNNTTQATTVNHTKHHK